MSGDGRDKGQSGGKGQLEKTCGQESVLHTRELRTGPRPGDLERRRGTTGDQGPVQKGLLVKIMGLPLS